MPEPLLNVIQYLSSGLALVAFIVAVIFYGYREKLRTQQKNIQHARPADVDDVIATANEYVKVNLDQIPKNQRKDIVLRQLEIKQLQQTRQGRNVLIFAVLLACLAAYAIAMFRPAQAPLSKEVAAKPVENIVEPNPKPIPIPPAITVPEPVSSFTMADQEGHATFTPPVTTATKDASAPRDLNAVRNTCMAGETEVPDPSTTDRIVTELRENLQSLHIDWGGKRATELPGNAKSNIIDVHREDSSLVLRYDWQDGIIKVWPTMKFGMSTPYIGFVGFWKQINGGGCLTLDARIGEAEKSTGTWFEGLNTEAGWSFQLKQN